MSALTLTFVTTASNQAIKIPLNGTFTNTTNWGDGNTDSTLQHTYVSAGTYNVSLTISTGNSNLSLGSGGWNNPQTLRQLTSFGNLNLTSISLAFQNCSNLTLVPSTIPSAINNLAYTFSGATSFNQNINGWDTINVQNMFGVFQGASSFNQPIGNWNVSNATNMGNMFTGATSFNQTINNWNTGNVQSMDNMFNGATSFNQPIGNWNTINVRLMNGMFSSATAFNQDIGNWNVSNVNNMYAMFLSATAFNQPIGNWNTISVQGMNSMFQGATSFNQNIGSWTTNNLQNMQNMFTGATSFNQNIGSWNISNVLNLNACLNGTGMTATKFDSLLIGWASQTVKPNLTLGASNIYYTSNGQNGYSILSNSPNNWTIQVAGIRPNATVSNFTIPTKNYGDASFGITDPSSNSTGTFTYSTDSSNIATINGKIITIVGGGTAKITASQGVTDFYSAGTIDASFTVNKINPYLSNFTIPTKNYGDASFGITDPSSNSTGTFTYIIDASNIATIDGKNITIVGTGTTNIRATQASNNNYNGGTIDASFTVNKANPYFTNFTIPTKNYTDASFTITNPSSNSTGTFSYSSSDTNVATISGNAITILSAGTSIITATQASTNNYNTGTISTTFLVNSRIPCFKHDTKILCFKEGREFYMNIQDIRNGDLVKTLDHGYLPVNMIGKRDIYHPASQERIKSQLYKCSQSEYPEIFEDLIITGCHCVLIDDFVNEEQRKKTFEVYGDIYVTESKYRLPSCIDERASVYENPGTYTIYHFALENDDYYMNYGIYANGLLVETSSKRYMKELSGMTFIE